ncbi:MAG: cation diffusion facilitator family transporter [Clostridiales bacterium]|nr:cation diffusion facilitator family transporter [Roseburia sp.]MDD7635476.1 cation diffusion facilitator family transporter [Clostridiales bacterium]MDY4112587.1 cation diffusion facilitator family transporter [Roseburia sp.]
MVALLAKIFIKEKDDKVKIRQSYGVLCGVVGILLNILLFLGKFLAGTISNSIAITADAFNNLSDAGSSFVTLVGFKLAGAKPDPEHPFGHGRMEYVSALVVSAAILLMAYELIRDSINKILHPEDTEFSALVLVILLVSIMVKLYMAYYNRNIGQKIDSAAMKATAMDSLSDTCATAVVLIATLVGHYTGLHIDGWCGALVGLFILYAGFNAAKETLDPLLGQPPEDEFVEEIQQIVMAHEGICGIHDLIVHDYGPGRQMISLHAEVSAEGDISEIHDLIDNIENELRMRLGCEATIHMDPIITTDEHIRELKETVVSIVKEIDEILSMHDFRVVSGPTHTNLIFDVIVPFKFHMTDDTLMSTIQTMVKERLGSNYYVVMKIDKSYVK